MGGCSTRSDIVAQVSEKSMEIPSPVVFRSKNFVFLHFTSASISYTGVDDLMTFIPDLAVSDVLYFQVTESDYVYKSRKVIQITGNSRCNSDDKDCLLIEKVGEGILVQFGSLKVIKLMLDYNYISVLYNKQIPQKTINIGFSQIIHFLYHFARDTSRGTDETDPLLIFITSVLRNITK